MKKFLIRLTLFFLVSLCVFLCFHITIQYFRDDYLRLPANVNKVFLGNSTFEYGIDDSLISNAQNFAQNAEPIDITYAKIKLLLRENPTIDTIFVELDDIVLYNDRLAPVISNSIYFDAFDFEDWMAYAKYYDFDRVISLFTYSYDILKIKPIITNFFKSHTIVDLGVGGYQDLYRNKLSEDINKIENEQKIGIDTQKVIPQGVSYYYSKIMSLNDIPKITIIFLNTPKHFKSYSDTTYIDFWKNHLSTVRLIDCTNLSLPDSCFADCSHLNYKGARIYSDSLAKIIMQ